MDLSSWLLEHISNHLCSVVVVWAVFIRQFANMQFIRRRLTDDYKVWYSIHFEAKSIYMFNSLAVLYFYYIDLYEILTCSLSIKTNNTCNRYYYVIRKQYFACNIPNLGTEWRLLSASGCHAVTKLKKKKKKTLIANTLPTSGARGWWKLDDAAEMSCMVWP